MSDAVDALYGLPPAEFVAARAVLVKELRAAGQKDAAVAAGKLVKPSVAAWAVNQVVRTTDLSTLVAAGESLRDAQAALLAGDGDRAAMRAATVELRRVLGELGAAAGALDGVGDAVVERVRETFQAAAVDPEAREAVLGGRLVKELQYSGIAAGVGGSAAPGKVAPRSTDASEPVRKATPRRSRGDEGERAAAAAREAEEARRAEEARAAEEARKAEEERREQERKAAEKAFDAAERAVEKARHRRDRAAAALDDAEQELERLEVERDEAAEARAVHT